MKITSDKEFDVMLQLSDKPILNQRQLAERASVSLGTVNTVLKALIERGWVEVKSLAQSSALGRNQYQLTPEGASAKVQLIKWQMAQKQQEVEQLQSQLEQNAERGSGRD